MLKSIRLENFYSFREAETIRLNLDTNLLVGINGSGKTNFIKAIQLLSDSMNEREGFQRTFNRWGGFDAVSNFSGSQLGKISLTFEFYADAIGSAHPDGFHFVQNPFYQIEIARVGNNSYSLSEKVFTEGKQGKSDFIYLQMKNGSSSVRLTIFDLITRC